MILFLRGHTYKYESEKVCRIFFPTEKIVFAEEGEAPPGETKRVETLREEKDGRAVYTCKAEIDGRIAVCSVRETPEQTELIERFDIHIATSFPFRRSRRETAVYSVPY